MYTESNGIINTVHLQLNTQIADLFHEKAQKLRSLTIKIDFETKLKFYGLLKTSTVGKFPTSNNKSVGFFDFAEKYKK